jgi:hypothetical protein
MAILAHWAVDWDKTNEMLERERRFKLRYGNTRDFWTEYRAAREKRQQTKARRRGRS